MENEQIDQNESEPLVMLPTSGPLGARETYAPTNLDLLANAYKQNDAINKVGGKVQKLATTVANHAEVINQLVQIKRIGWSLLSLVGFSGIIAICNWLKLWVHPS